jgi:hypothetical protein
MSPPDGAAELRRIIEMAEDVTPEPPRPLMRELPAADPFPIDALGNVLGAAAVAIHDRVQAPIAIGGQSVIGAATLAAQGHADVVLPIGPGQPKPISSFLITVASAAASVRSRATSKRYGRSGRVKRPCGTPTTPPRLPFRMIWLPGKRRVITPSK